MTKNLKRIVLVLCMVALCASFLGTTAFAASDSLVAEIPVSITLNGTLPKEAETFVVQVTPASAGCPLPEGAAEGVYSMELTAVEGNSVSTSFSIDFAPAGLGVYEYSVQLIAGSDPDCFYDESVYNVKVYIVNKEDFSGYEMHVVITSGEDKPDSIDFVNRYCNPAKVTISGVKTVNGGMPLYNMFKFRLEDENEKLIAETMNNAGSITFEPLVFGEPEDLGKHTYTLYEVDENANSVVYDKTRYTVVIDVTKDENGDYQAKVTYLLKGEAFEGSPAFANKIKYVNSPYTGDNLQILLWGGLMIVSAVALLAVLLIARKKKATAMAYQNLMDQDTDADLDEE